MITFDRVTFTYPDAPVPVLRDVSFAIEDGAFVLVCGPTGAGKSTLLRAVNGLVPHFSGGTFRGRVTVGGRDTTEMPPRKLADTVAFVPQDPNASFVLDRVEDEIAYALENLGIEPQVMRRRVEEALDLMGIAALRDRSVRDLSGGERQRVAIAAALAPGTRVLVLDEPTSQLDPQAAEDVVAALQRLVHDLGITVLLAEHRFERVAGAVDSVLACPGDGRVAHGAPDEMFELLGSGPPVTRLGRLLGWTPLPLTVRAARRHAAGTALPAMAPRAPAAGEVIARLSSASVSYGATRALRDASLEVRRGEVVVVMGRNGAGKTTLLRCLAGLQVPERGTADVLGAPPQPGRTVALCPQRPEDLLFASSVADEVGDPALLERFGLAAAAGEHPRDLSAGMRLLVAVAATAATGAPLLLLDEPTRGLDPAAKAALTSYLRERGAQGLATVVATHDVELAGECATRAVVLAEGEAIADGDPAHVLGDSPVFAPQTARVFGAPWLTPEQVAAALA